MDVVEDTQTALVIADDQLFLTNVRETRLIGIESHRMHWFILVHAVDLEYAAEEHRVLLAARWFPHDLDRHGAQEVELFENAARLLRF